MQPYPEIKNLFKRDLNKESPTFGKAIMGDFTMPEYEVLFLSDWEATEKIDGTNVRVIWDGSDVQYLDRRGKGELPPILTKGLKVLLPQRDLSRAFGSQVTTLYGEGYGAGIQKGGDRYIPDDVGFILFDVFVPDRNAFGGWWLQRDNLEGIAESLQIPVVPIIGKNGASGKIGDTMLLYQGMHIVKNGLKSTFGDFDAEGLVLRPKVQLFARTGERLIVKVKGRDY